jgi:hypothetical protein
LHLRGLTRTREDVGQQAIQPTTLKPIPRGTGATAVNHIVEAVVAEQRAIPSLRGSLTTAAEKATKQPTTATEDRATSAATEIAAHVARRPISRHTRRPTPAENPPRGPIINGVTIKTTTANSALRATQAAVSAFRAIRHPNRVGSHQRPPLRQRPAAMQALRDLQPPQGVKRFVVVPYCFISGHPFCAS